MQAEQVSKTMGAAVGQIDRALSSPAFDPVAFEKRVGDGRTELPGQMMPLLAPVNAEPQQLAPGRPLGLQVYPQFAEDFVRGGAQLIGPVRQLLGQRILRSAFGTGAAVGPDESLAAYEGRQQFNA